MNQAKAFGAERRFECDSLPLNTLLNGDVTDPQFASIAGHVESCENCQQRLQQLAADPQQWVQVGALLRRSQECEPADTQELRRSNAASSNAADEYDVLPHLRGVLDDPVHPEMLGRLGRYDIESVIGRGGMGIVLRGFDSELHRPVAIKILASHLAHSGPARQRFARESRAAAAVVHEHVVAIHDVQTDGQNPFLVMQYVAGESLQSRVERQGPLSVKELLRIGMQAAAGLQAAHVQGVVHRDIKPANILLEPGIDRALVTDFGLARTVDDASLTQTGVVAGSPHYMSPEQAQGQATDARTDIYSLGAVMYFMATGHPPFRAERAMGVLNRICHEPHRPVWESNPEIPDSVSKIIDRCLHKKEPRRFASAAEVQTALGRALANLQQRTRPRATLFRKLRHNRRLLLVPLAASVLVIGLGTWQAWWRTTPADFRGELRPQESGWQVAPQAHYSVEIWQQASPSEVADWNLRLVELMRAIGEPDAPPIYEPVDDGLPQDSDRQWTWGVDELRQLVEPPPKP